MSCKVFNLNFYRIKKNNQEPFSEPKFLYEKPKHKPTDLGSRKLEQIKKMVRSSALSYWTTLKTKVNFTTSEPSLRNRFF